MATINGDAMGNDLDGDTVETDLNDVINGLGGNDTLNGLTGNDTLNGGDGDDKLEDGDRTTVLAPDEEDNDILRGGAGNDHLQSWQSDPLFVNDRDTLEGGDGDDILEFFGTQTGDSADGGAGRDRFVLRVPETTKNVSAFFDGIQFTTALQGVATAIATNVEDVTVLAGSGTDLLLGGAGNDLLSSQNGGNDSINGGAGDDIVQVEYSTIVFDAPTLDGGEGTDTLVYAVVFPTTQNYTINLPGNTWLRGAVSLGAFSNIEKLIVTTSDGADTIIGGSLEDSLSGWGGADSIFGGGGNDTLAGWDGDDYVDGGTGDDGLSGGNGNDELLGGTGDDTLDGGGGDNTLDGGVGDDTYTVTSSATATTIVDASGNDTIRTNRGTFTLEDFPDIETLVAITSSNARYTGNAADNTIYGNNAADTLSGNAGFDTLIGGDGNDTLDGGSNPATQGDIMLGGLGNDIYHVDSGLDLVDEGIVFGGAAGGVDTIFSHTDFFWDFYSAGDVLAIAADAMDAGGDGTTIVGSVFSNFMVGNAGTNVLFGRGGSDTYIAGDGIDFISLSTLGLTDANSYAGVNGVNTVIVQQRQTGPVSYDIVFEFESGKDKLDVSDYGFASKAAAYATGVNDGAGNCYFVLGDGFDYLYIVGKTLDALSASDFVV